MLETLVWINKNVKNFDESQTDTSDDSSIRDDSQSDVFDDNNICDFFQLSNNIDNGSVRKSLVETDYHRHISEVPVPSDIGIESFYRVTIRRLPKLDNSLMKTVCVVIVNNCIDQLTLLTSAYKPIVGEVERRNIVYKPLEERYEFNKPVNYEDYVINSNYTNFHKILKDVNTLIVVLRETSDEINVFSCVSSLNNYTESEIRMQKDEEKFLESVKKKQQLFEYLNKSYENLRSEYGRKCKELDKQTCKLFVTMKDDMEYARTELSFAQRWEAARIEQNSLVFRNKEERLKSIIKDMETATTLDHIVHQNICKFIAEAQKDNYNEIERWMETYDRQLEERDMDIYRIKHQTDLLMEKKEALQREYERRTQAMEDWMVYKRQKKEIEEKIALENWAAIKIQSWWRGEMFRKKLGPYRKKKKGKAAKNKSKGTKKAKKVKHRK